MKNNKPRREQKRTYYYVVGERSGIKYYFFTPRNAVPQVEYAMKFSRLRAGEVFETAKELPFEKIYIEKWRT